MAVHDSVLMVDTREKLIKFLSSQHDSLHNHLHYISGRLAELAPPIGR